MSDEMSCAEAHAGTALQAISHGLLHELYHFGTLLAVGLAFTLLGTRG